MKRVITIILTIVFAAGILASCSDPSQTVVATVNGENIYKSEADVIIGFGVIETYNNYAQLSAQFGMEEKTIDEIKKDNDIMQNIKSNALEVLTRQRAAIITARKNGAEILSEEKIKEAREEAQGQIDGLRDGLRQSVEQEKEENPTINVEKRVSYLFDQEMKNYGFTVEAYIENSVRQAEYLAASEYIASTLEITDEECKKYLDEQIQSQKESYDADQTSLANAETVYYYPEGSVYVKHVLIKLSDEDTTEVQAIEDTAEQKRVLNTKLPSIKSKADEVYGKAATEDFDKLIDEYGEDPGMQEGSSYKETGYFIYPGSQQMMQEFTDASLKLKLNEISAPTATSYGYHIIKCIKIPETLKLETLTAEQREQIETTLKDNYTEETIDKWKSECEIVTYPERMGIKKTPEESTEPESNPEESQDATAEESPQP